MTIEKYSEGNHLPPNSMSINQVYLYTVASTSSAQPWESSEN